MRCDDRDVQRPLRRTVVLLALWSNVTAAPAAQVEAQPLAAQVRRVVEAFDLLGEPLPEATRDALRVAMRATADADVVAGIRAALDPLCLAIVHINPESRVKATRGEAAATLVEGGWRSFLVRVDNEAGVTGELRVTSPNARRVFEFDADEPIDMRERWMDAATFARQPMQRTLSGLELEYRIVQLYSRDAGRREAKLAFDVGQGTQDLGFRSEIDVLFDCAAASELSFRVRDTDGTPTTAAFVIRDAALRVHPAQAKRLAPDFPFQEQVYRADGESVRLPRGRFTIEVTRGPEYLPQTGTVTMSGEPQAFTVDLRRWIDPAARGWWSGDHHIHAAGCAHYESPSEGVHAPDMMRHCLGEDLKVGCNLTWGPCFDYQKQFFTGKHDAVSRPPYLLRYDIEISGFGSHKSGHLCLLRLTEQIPPGGDSDRHWPTLGLNNLRWAKKQGAVCGPAHSGFGLAVPGTDLPSYTVPAFDGIGACETIAAITHEVEGKDGALVPAVDFISTVDTPCLWELNLWYHLLNCGFRPRISGETDFPCIYGERVGMGRSYVKVDGDLDFDRWCDGIRAGRAYVSEGRSHLLDFAVGGVRVGEGGSELRLAAPGKVSVRADVAALLGVAPRDDIANRPLDEKPYWHLERARKGTTRKVPVEVIVNGKVAAVREIEADGSMTEVACEVAIERSAWVALRVLWSSHTNPVFVVVGDAPIRASKRSARWCLAGVERCRQQKARFIADGERADFTAAYDHAAATYRRIVDESVIE